MGISSPNAVLDLTKPVLSLRNQVKHDVVQREFINRANKLKLAAKNKRGSTLVHNGNASVVSAPAQRKRVKTREDSRPRFKNRDLDHETKPAKSKKSKSPSHTRVDSNGRQIRIRKKKRSKASNKIRKFIHFYFHFEVQTLMNFEVNYNFSSI